MEVKKISIIKKVKKYDKRLKLTIVYDNEVFQKGLVSDWGFSCYVQTPEANLFFDTGAKGNILLGNMTKLAIDPNDIDAIMLSHDHWDHTGGLNNLLELNPEVTVYEPTFSTTPKEFLKGIMTTGTLVGISGIKEQSLIIKTSKGLVVICGCSHPGLENILEVARNLGEVFAVLGGFHGFNKFDTLEGISLILPCHCTEYKQKILNLYPKTCNSCGAGKIIEI